MNTIFILVETCVFWGFGGAVLYHEKVVDRPLNYKQKLFMRVICGPIVWIFLLLRLLGMIGDKMLNSILNLLK